MKSSRRVNFPYIHVITETTEQPNNHNSNSKNNNKTKIKNQRNSYTKEHTGLTLKKKHIVKSFYATHASMNKQFNNLFMAKMLTTNGIMIHVNGNISFRLLQLKIDQLQVSLHRITFPFPVPICVCQLGKQICKQSTLLSYGFVTSKKE